MGSSALQPLGGWRNEACLIPIAVPGLDLTGRALRAQLRQSADNPILTLNLPQTTDPAATGLRLVSVTTDASGVPTSNLMWQISKPDMQALPYAGELGDAWVGSYAMQIDGQTRMFGPFGAISSPIDSDAAPANRPISYGAASHIGGPTPGVTLTIGAGGVTVWVYGLVDVQRAVAIAVAKADVATTQANAAAQSSAVARQAAMDAGAYLAGVKAITRGSPTSAQLPLQATSRAILAGFAGEVTGRQAYLSEQGRHGYWTRDTALTAAMFAADALQGLYVATPNEAGGWRRQIPQVTVKPTYQASWFGLGAGYGNDADVLINAALALMPVNSDLVLPAAPDITFGHDVNSGQVLLDKVGQMLVGAGAGATVVSTSVIQNNGNALIRCRADYTGVDGMTLIGGRTNQGANNVATVWVSATGRSYTETSVNCRIANCIIDGSIGVLFIPPTQVVNGQDVPQGSQAGGIVENCTFIGQYQAVSCFQSQGVRIRKLKCIFNSPTGEQFNVGIRMNGGIDTVVEDLEIYGQNKITAGIICNASAIGTHRQRSKNAFFRNVRMYGVVTGIWAVECEGILDFDDIYIDNDVTSTNKSTAVYIEANGQTNGSNLTYTIDRLRINNLRAVGVTSCINGTATANEIGITSCKFKGNARPVDGTADNLIVMTEFDGQSLKRFEVKDTDFDFDPAKVNYHAQMTGTKAGESYIVTGNRFPANANGTHIQGGGAGNFVTSLSAGTTPAADSMLAGDNGCFPS